MAACSRLPDLPTSAAVGAAGKAGGTCDSVHAETPHLDEACWCAGVLVCCGSHMPLMTEGRV